MGLNMNGLMNNVQGQVKSSSLGLATLVIKIITGLMLGLTFALIAEEAFKIGTFSFVLINVVFVSAFLKIAKSWKLMTVLLFDAFIILIGFLLKMYILIAPGA